MASDDVKMTDAAKGTEVEGGTQPEQSSRERKRKANGDESDDDGEIRDVLGDCSNGVPATTSARTPVSAAGAGAADTAATTSNGRKTPVDRPTREDPAAVEKLRAYVSSLGGTLPQGWVGVYRMRMGGTSAGQYDLYYKSPEGRLIRSRAEVLRLLGLDPSGGSGSVPPQKKSANKGSKKRAAGCQPLEEGTAQAATPASPGDRGGSGAAGGKWTLPLEMPRKDALKAAKARAAELGLKPPFATDRGVTILSLGTFHEAPGFYDATHIWPLGFRAAWVPPHDPAAAAKKKSKKKGAPAEKEATEAGNAGDAVAKDGEEKAKFDAKAAEPVSAVPARPPLHRFVSEIRLGDTKLTGDGPAFAVLLEPNPDAPAAVDRTADSKSEPLLVHIAMAPDAAWSAIPDLQLTATALCKRAKPNGAGVQPSPMQRALAAMPPVGKVWGMDCFGLSDVRVLQLLEALPGVDACEEYFFVQQRNSWELEASAMATKRSVVMSAAPNRRAAAAATKQRKQQHQLSIEAFVDRGLSSPKMNGLSKPAVGDGLEDLATAAGAAAGPGKKSKVDGKTPAGATKGEKPGRMRRDDVEIRGVLDRLVERVSLVMAEPDENERQKMLKAMEKSDRAAARRREKTAEKAAAGATPSTGRPDKDNGADKQKEEKKQVKSSAKSRIAKEKDAGAATTKGADGDTEAAPEGAAAAAAPLQPLPAKEVDERSLPTAQVPAPAGLPLALSFAIGEGIAAETAVGNRTSGATAPVALSPDEIQRLLSVYQFLWDHRRLLGIEGRVPSLADLLTVVSEPPARLSAPARRAADEVHLSLIRLLVGEALDELLEHTAQTSNLHRRDLSAAVPPITAATWPELARRYLAAAAAARYLATSEPRSSALMSLELPGQLQNLEPADWLHYLLAGLNFPHLLSRIALLPHASSRWAADALLATDDARARAAAERALQGIESFDLQHLDGEGQVRRGRRLLHALLTLPEGGEELGFYAPEFSEVLRAPRGLDLHMVAARLDAGLYQCVGDWMQAIAMDIRSALALWRAALSSSKGKDIPGHQDARLTLADEAEQVLNELLADPDNKLALPASTDTAVALKTDVETEMQDTDVGSGKTAGKASKLRKSRSAHNRKQQGEDGNQAVGEDDERDKDPFSLDDPTRLFNPRDGCRVCWLDEDKNRILLCDGCDGEYHCYCVEPPLLEVPEGSWFCPSCTARGMGLPKAEDESEDLIDLNAAGERHVTPRASTPRRIAAAAAAGGASISPSDDSAQGRTPCSPAFQHCHSHSHLVSDLHDRAAARRLQSCMSQAAVDAVALVMPAAGNGATGIGLGEAPLSIPPDVPEGPRVTLRANSRPGLQELEGLLRLAHLLGNYDYATGGPVSGVAGAEGIGGGWTPARRLTLLFTLCELAMDTNALRSSLDEIVEMRKKARVEANSIRSKARQIQFGRQEEQAAEKKAAAEKENAPKLEGDVDANANGSTAVASSKGGKGSKAGSTKGGSKDAKAKGDKLDKATEATGRENKDAADEEGATQEAKDGKEGGETTATKSRSKMRTDLSVLSEEELKRLMSLEAQMEGLAIRQEPLGEDRHGSRYWWLGADYVDPKGPQGVVLVEQLPPGFAIMEQAKASQAFNERQLVRQKEEENQKAAEEKKKAAGLNASASGDADGTEEQELDEWGLPKERSRPRTVAIGFDTIPGLSWVLFYTPAQLNTLIGWLNPKGMREGPLRTALLRARDRIAASQVPAAAGDKQKQPAAAVALASSNEQPQQQLAEGAREGESGGAVPLPPPQVLCPVVTVATAGGRRGGTTVARQGSAALAEMNVEVTGSLEAVALRTELLGMYRSLPMEAFSRFWGSAKRQKNWCLFVEGATSPQQICAALTVLEAMLIDEAFRPHWRLYCMPAQHPELCTTWAAAWYRLGSLQAAIRKQIIAPREVRHQTLVEAAMAAGGGKSSKAAMGKKEKAGKKEHPALILPQERYPPRRGGSAAPPLPDISNVRSREAAALLGIPKGYKDVGAVKGQKGAVGGDSRGQKRHRNVAGSGDGDDEGEDAEDAENTAGDHRGGKRIVTTGAKDRIQRPAAGGRANYKAKEQLKDGEIAEEEEEENRSEADDDDEEESASSSGAEVSVSVSEDDDEEAQHTVESSDEESSDAADRKRKAQPSRAITRRVKKVEKVVPMARRSSRLTKVESEDDNDSSSSDSEENERRAQKTRRSGRSRPKVETEEEEPSSGCEKEEENLSAKRTRGAASSAKVTKGVALAAGAPKTRSRAVPESDRGDNDSDEKSQAVKAKGAQGRTRGITTAPAKQEKGLKPALGSRAAAILANRKRALADWSEKESEDEGEGKRSSGSDGALSSEDEPPVTKRGRLAAREATLATATGKRGVSKQQPQKVVPGKLPPRRMARSEVKYDVEDFDDLNT